MTKKDVVKIMTIGSEGVGKTSCLISYFSKEFPSADDVPAVFDYIYMYPISVIINDKKIKISLWDTKLDPEVSFPNTNVFFLLYSINSRSSYNDCKSYWHAKIQKYLPNVPVVLVATKCDLRDDFNYSDILSTIKSDGYENNDDNSAYDIYMDKSDYLTYEEGERMACEIGAVGFYEISSLKMKGLDEVFDILSVVGHSHILRNDKTPFFPLNINNNIEEEDSDTENNNNNNNVEKEKEKETKINKCKLN